MASVTIKGREEKLQVIIQDGIGFSLMLEDLREKLVTMQRLSHTSTWEAFFCIPSVYDERELYELFKIVNEYQGLIVGFDSNQIQVPDPYEVIEQEIRSGEHRVFTKPVVIFGNIHKDAFVSSSYDVFVMGMIEGTISLFRKEAIVYAMSLHQANIQIFDVIRPNVTSNVPKKLYYLDIQCKEWNTCHK